MREKLSSARCVLRSCRRGHIYGGCCSLQGGTYWWEKLFDTFRLFLSVLHNIYAKNTTTDAIIINMTREKLDVVQQATKENCGNNTEISYARRNLMN